MSLFFFFFAAALLDKPTPGSDDVFWGIIWLGIGIWWAVSDA